MRSSWVLLLAVPALAQPPCTVQAEERLASVTTRFSVGPANIAMTLPVGFRVEFLTFYLEVTNLQPDLSFEAGNQKVPARHGASISLEPAIEQRPTFSITDSHGRRLCSWQPSERIWAYDPPLTSPRVERLLRLMRNAIPTFFIAGDPIFLYTRSRTAREFTIDNQPAMVLARTTRQVILRDPNPSAGFRTVKAQGYEAILAMVQTRWRLEGGALQLDAFGPEVFVGPATVTIFNFNPAAAALQCGARIRRRNWPEAARLSLAGDDKGVFSASCKVKILTAPEVRFDIVLQEEKARRPVQPALPRLLTSLPERLHG